MNQYNVIIGDPTTLTASAYQRVLSFVKNGGGIVETDFGANSNSQDNILGLSTSSTPASPTSSLNILSTSSRITVPYTSLRLIQPTG